MTKKVKEGNHFVLKGRKGTYIKNKIEVDFTPIKCQSIIPTFNNDRKYFTPSFIVPRMVVSDDQTYRTEHENKISSTAQKSQQNIFVPKPGPRKKYCSVCSKQYQDYLQHIYSPSHKEQLKNSQFQNQILKMSEKIRNQRQLSQISFSSLEKKSVTSTQIQEDESPMKEGITKVYHV